MSIVSLQSLSEGDMKSWFKCVIAYTILKSILLCISNNDLFHYISIVFLYILVIIIFIIITAILTTV